MADPSESQREADGARHRTARVLLGVHAVAFILVLLGLILRWRYVAAEGIVLDPILVAFTVAGTVLFCTLPPLLMVRRRRARLGEAVEASFPGSSVVYAYWSRTESPGFLDALPRGLAARGFQVAVITDAQGLRVGALAGGRLIDFGPVPWDRIARIEGAPKEIGIGLPTKSGVLRIRMGETVAPYRSLIELFPSKGTAAGAATVLLGARQQNS